MRISGKASFRLVTIINSVFCLLFCYSNINFKFHRNVKDLLSSVHRLPPTKTSGNSYRMTADEWISNMTVLIMQLVQSVVKVKNLLLLITLFW